MRRFTGKEMNEILRIADSGDSQDFSSASARFSLAEIQKAGSELGYDAERLEAAAAQVAARPSPKHPLVHEFETVHPSPLSAAAWEEVVIELRSELGTPGTVRDRADGGREWIAAADERTVTVTTSPASDAWHLSLRFDEGRGAMALQIFSGSIFIVLCMNAANSVSKPGWGSPDTALTFFVAAEFLGAVLAIRWGRRTTRARAEKIARRLNDIALQDVSPIRLGRARERLADRAGLKRVEC